MTSIPPIYFREPAALPEHFAQAWNERKAEAIAGLFSEDAEFINVVGLWWHDRQAIFKAHDYGLKHIFDHSHLEIRQTKVRELSEDFAIVYSRMRLSGQTAHGMVDQPGVRFNIFSFVVQRREAGWICISAHNTDQIPGKETNVVGPSGDIEAVDYRDQ
ncbi:YybH family protein [Flavilitoribacter nigricans]|uniref:DUF4440 domain-containing protein n=1 Tax=Flavilitoribacter nigricans (strain ATCC 23147 / DSM 23189 / NBRC 102662 / NCIMB 1420 / SS-2) TaxID=1122177 RepID=A0A2D0N3M4_FLAN2|nr:SgcJ/EcaC family oxidoreductase [Flavilitoribacter nigricans]PHN03142.1 DUF4440 domain-containing protein [Flavilitoribacter nigricans DSM 23189 = NBRC 102662]